MQTILIHEDKVNLTHSDKKGNKVAGKITRLEKTSPWGHFINFFVFYFFTL